MHLYYFMEGTNLKITMFAHFQEYHRNRKLFRMFLIVCKLNSLDILRKSYQLFLIRHLLLYIIKFIAN